jgi:DNA-binding NarL/FixJ family response regulator
LRVLDLRL